MRTIFHLVHPLWNEYDETCPDCNPRRRLERRAELLDWKIDDLDEQISHLEELRAELVFEQADIEAELNEEVVSGGRR